MTEFVTLLILSFVGGLLLNFMPCALPVLSLKAMSLEHREHGPFALGMVLVTLALAALGATTNFAWGEQFHSQPVTILTIVVLVAAGLCYLGVFELPTLSVRLGKGKLMPMGQGILAALLGTSCSGPFLGPVFAATLGTPPLCTFAIFTVIGLGMASPFILLSVIPEARHLVPKPGPWMDTFRRVAGFGLLGTALWLSSGLDDRWLFPTLTLALATSFFLVFRTKYALSVAIVCGALPFVVSPSEVLPWQRYSQENLQENLMSNRVVAVQFTSPFCLTCKLNETILNTSKIQRTIKKHDAVLLRADITDRAAKALLNELGGDSVPTLAIYGRDGVPVLIPDLITPNMVVRALDFAGK